MTEEQKPESAQKNTGCLWLIGFLVALVVFAVVATRETPQKEPTIDYSMASKIFDDPQEYRILGASLSADKEKHHVIRIEVADRLLKTHYEAIAHAELDNLVKQAPKTAVFEIYEKPQKGKKREKIAIVDWAPYGGSQLYKKGVFYQYDTYSFSTREIIPKPVSSARQSTEGVAGLPLAVRKRIYYNIVKEEDRLHGQQNSVKRAAQNMAKKYNLTVSQINKIGWEGVEKNWPDPPL